MAEKDLLLITGGAGMIAPSLAAHLASEYRIRLTDREEVSTEFEFHRADLTDFSALAEACRGTRAIVHLGAASWEYDAHQVLIPSNVVGTYNLFEAARRAGVRRVVFASTHHALGYHFPDEPRELAEDTELRPDTVYAATKIFGEALGRQYAERYGLSVHCLRIGFYLSPERITAGLSRAKEALLLSPRDLAAMVRLSLASTSIHYGVYNCTSRARQPWLSLEKARLELGYEPLDTVESCFGPDARTDVLRPEDWRWLRGPFPGLAATEDDSAE